MRRACDPLRFRVVGDVPSFTKRLGLLLMIIFLGTVTAAELRTVSEIRNLSREESNKMVPASVKGSVTFVMVWGNKSEATVQDSTAGIYSFMQSEDAARLRLGNVVEIKGHATEGAWAPCLRVSELVITNEKKTLPVPRKADYTSLKSGVMDSQFVEIEGMVRDVQYDSTVHPASTILTIAMEGGRAEVFMPHYSDEEIFSLVDSKVRVTGVTFHYFNQRRQAFEFRIMVAERSQVVVTESPPSDAFDLPMTPMGKLLQYNPNGYSEHRSRVKGVVTLHRPGEFLFLQEGEDGLLVRSRRKEKLDPGDLVEVAGFPSMGTYTAFLEDGDIRDVDSGLVPTVVEMPLEELATGTADARLVQTQGVLESISERNGRAFLMLRKGSLIVPADLPVPMKELPPLINGSIVRLTGICQVELGSQRRFARLYRPESAKILLRSVDDIVVMRAAPWWTESRLSVALATLIGVLTLSGIWGWSLKSKNARLRREIKAREHAEEEVKRREEERRLLAADLHDSLEQSLTGVALQLQAAGRLKDGRSSPLDPAERLLKYSRDEVHRAVRDLRQPTHEAFDPRHAIREMVKRSEAVSGVRFVVDLPETLTELPGHLSHQLLHLAQEGVTNALKHAEAKEIRISLAVDDEGIRFGLADDGKGFDPVNHPGVTDGHFGLQGMKERVARLGGRLTIESNVGEETRIDVTLPFDR